MRTHVRTAALPRAHVFHRGLAANLQCDDDDDDQDDGDTGNDSCGGGDNENACAAEPLPICARW